MPPGSSNASAEHPQMLLWQSANGYDWEFKSVMWELPGAQDGFQTSQGGVWTNNRFDCPDSWELPDGRQIITVLGSLWGIGEFDRETGRFTAEHTGIGGCGPQQSMYDDKGRRVQFCSEGFALPGANYSGVQSFARQVQLSPDGRRLVFTYLPELTSLHGERRNFSVDVSATEGARYLVPTSDRFGLNMHARVAITVAGTCGGGATSTQVKGAVVLTVSCGDVTATVAMRVGSGAARLIAEAASTAATPFTVSSTQGDGVSTVAVEAFLDGGFVDLIGADRELQQSFAVASNNTGSLPVPRANQPTDWAPTGTGVAVGVRGGAAHFEAVLYNMKRGVEACPGH